MRKLFIFIIIIGIAVFAYTHFHSQNDAAKLNAHYAVLSIVSGSENKGLEPIIQKWAKQQGYSIHLKYMGSVDISHCLKLGKGCEYDAIWPANSLWITLGDTQHVVRHEKSILRSPVVLGLKKTIAESLGWIDNPNVTITDILNAAEAGKFRLGMTSATQSNSGTSAYIGFLYAMAKRPDILLPEHLNDPTIQDRVRRILATVDRGSGSSGWLKEAYVANPDKLDAIFNYEAMIIEANLGWTNKHGKKIPGLVARNQEPLYAIYPTDGIMIADSTLGYIDKNNAAKENVFLALQNYLLSKSIQEQIKAMGRRTGIIGLDVEAADTFVWNPQWGIDIQRQIATIPVPSANVIMQALNLYQTSLRKPSLTVWVLDVSGSMGGDGIQQLRNAMFNLLDPTIAATNLLQIGAKDVTIVIPFNHGVVAVWKLTGNQSDEILTLLQKTQTLHASGGTNMYGALLKALEEIHVYHNKGTLWNYLPAIVAMTDGRSDSNSKSAFLHQLDKLPFGKDIPIHAIAFGNSDESQLRQLTKLSIGRLFHSKGDLPKTLRKAKGYN